MRAHTLLGAWIVPLVTACAAGSTAQTVEPTPDVLDVSDATTDVIDAADVVNVVDTGPRPRAAATACAPAASNCMSCPLDCNRCPTCDMAPTCTGALAAPTSSTPLMGCDNTLSGSDRTNYVCGTDLGVAPEATTCADPQLRIRLKGLTIRRGFFDIPRNLYCAITAEDGRHSELLLTTPREVAGNRNTTEINFRLGEGVLWGQEYLPQHLEHHHHVRVLHLVERAVGAARARPDRGPRGDRSRAQQNGYGWVFGTVAVLGTIIGSSISGLGDTQILDVQQTISSSALLSMTNGRTWTIRGQRGNLDLSGASDLRLTMESWGCAGVRVVAP